MDQLPTSQPLPDHELLHPLDNEKAEHKKLMVWIGFVGSIASLIIAGAFFFISYQPDSSQHATPTPPLSKANPKDKTTEDIVRLLHSNIQPTAMPGNASLWTLGETGPVKLTSFIQHDVGDNSNALPYFADGVIYYVNDSRVFALSVATNTQKTVATLNIPEKMIVSRLVYHDNHVYITYAPKDYYADIDKFEVHDLNLLTQEDRTLKGLQPVLYGGFDYLFHSGNSDVLASFGGDGCSGWGTFYRYHDQTVTPIATSGAGCSKDPRFLGAVEGQNALLFASVIVPDTTTPGADELFEYPYNELYYQDVSTGEKTILLDMKTVPGKIHSLLLNDTKDTVAIITESSLTLFHLDTKQMDASVEAAMKNLWPVYFSGKTLFANDYTNQDLSLIDTTTGIGKTYAWKNLSGNATYAPQMLGVWNQKPLFLKYDSTPSTP